MVLLAAAAITAAGYGAYRGGDAAVRKGKSTHKEMKRERNRQSQKEELTSKSKDRKERIAQLASRRQQTTASNNALAPTTATTRSTTWPLSSSSSKAEPTTTTVSTSSSTDDRHKSVMEKLRNDRKNDKSKQGGTFSKLFKRKS